MLFHDTGLATAHIIDLEERKDERGSFARIWCDREFHAQGLRLTVVQASLSVTNSKGTLRGLHFQAAPSREGKIVRCLRGSVHDVIVDLRPDSSTFLRHFAAELSSTNRRAIYVPPGFAHGFQTLQDDIELLYLMTDHYAPDLGRGFRWDDPSFGIAWPLQVSAITARDRDYPDFEPGLVEGFRGY